MKILCSVLIIIKLECIFHTWFYSWAGTEILFTMHIEGIPKSRGPDRRLAQPKAAWRKGDEDMPCTAEYIFLLEMKQG
jgi:hypothetical protein